MDKYWARLERHLREQEAEQTKLDAVVELAPAGQTTPVDREDKVVIRLTRSKWEVAPYGAAVHLGVPKSRHDRRDEAIYVARRAVHAVGLHAVGARRGRGGQ